MVEIADLKIQHRQEFRSALADFLRYRMQSAKNVFDYMPSDLKGNLPLVAVVSAPSNRIPDTLTQDDNQFGFTIRNVVLYFLEGQTDWTPADAENLLDQLEYEVAFALRQARKVKTPWRTISRNGMSIIEGPYQVGGVVVLSETIPVIVEVSDESE